ncbi:MAG: histidinol-phosphatase HisJ family protein [Lentisphaeria bacterium]|nr:histidinol-phosphatase HisJ family protein [Lentisphaeria bacterium]
MILADLHTHTKLCNHAAGEPGEYLHAAINRGLAYLGVSDHIPWPAGYDSQWRMTSAQFPLYRSMVRNLQKAAEKSPVQVLYAIELDYVPVRMQEVYDSIAGEPFDYRIGSVHYTDFGFDDPDMLHRWQEQGAELIWNDYADRMCAFADSCDFEIMAHPDLPKKFKIYPADMTCFIKRMREAFEVAAAKGIAVEINTAGMRKPAGEFYPSLELLKAAREAGMPLTLGSDAHKPEDVAADFDRAVEFARTAGYRSALTFQAGKSMEMPFD